MNLLHMLSVSLNCAMTLGGSECHLPTADPLLFTGLDGGASCKNKRRTVATVVRRDTKRTKMPWKLAWQPGRTYGEMAATLRCQSIWDGSCVSHRPVWPIPGWETFRSQRREPRGHWTLFICCQIHGDQRGRPCRGMVVVSSSQTLAKCLQLHFFGDLPKGGCLPFLLAHPCLY